MAGIPIPILWFAIIFANYITAHSYVNVGYFVIKWIIPVLDKFTKKYEIKCRSTIINIFNDWPEYTSFVKAHLRLIKVMFALYFLTDVFDLLDPLYLPTEYAYLTYYPCAVSIGFIYMWLLSDFI